MKDLLDELAKNGWELENIYDLVNTRKKYPEIIPILVDYLQHVPS